MRVSALLGLLIPLVSIVALSAPDSGPTLFATVALATIATHANIEYRPALRAATYPQPKDTVAVNGRIRHPGIMPSPGGPPSTIIGQMICAFGADDVAGSRPSFRKLRFQMIANISLIELSIVLVIISLIVGGVLVGQNLIAAAGIRSTIAQLDRYTTAANAFRLKYDCIPGDCANAVNLGLGTAGGPGDNGDGNGQVYSASQMWITWGGWDKEAFNFWYHLQQANMIEGGYTGYPAGGFAAFGGDFTGYAPVAKIRSTAFINALSITDTSQGSIYFGNSFTLAGNNCGGMCGVLSGAEAYAIDSKIDDGFPQSGVVQSMNYYSGPIVGQSGEGCGYPVNGIFIYDVKGKYQSWNSQILNTPPNPGQLGCLLAFTRRF